MHKLDAFSNLDEVFTGIYDIVHLRLFTVIVKINDPAPLLRNLIKMLSKIWTDLINSIDALLTKTSEPGGFIQWDEHDHMSQKVITANSATDPKTIHALLDYVRPLDEKIGPRRYVATSIKKSYIPANGLT